MHSRFALVLLAVLMLQACQSTRYVPAELKGTPTDQLAKIMPGKAGLLDTPEFMLSSVDGVRMANSFDGASPAVYVAPGAHEFVIKGKYHEREYYNKGARVGSAVVTSPGYATFASSRWEERDGTLELDAGMEYTIEELYTQLPAGER
ncbi:MAG: hypothetical protein AAF432_14410 [Planctomycetota bacterium]